MTAYENSNSGVTAYEIRDDAIVVEFRQRGKYLYSNDNPGREEVEEMKRLALEGRGLATYINKNVRKLFAKKL